MKKILLLITLMCTLLVGCNSKAIDTSTFSSIAEESGYVIQDCADEFRGTNIEGCIVAQDSDKRYKIEFYIFDTAQSANATYTKYKEEWHNEETGHYTSITVGNRMKYIHKTKEESRYMSIIGNTLIYSVVDAEFDRVVDTFIKDVGY